MLWWFRIISSLWELKTTFADSCWKRLDACNKIHYIYLVILWKTNIFFSQVFQAKQATVSIFVCFFCFLHSKQFENCFQKNKTNITKRDCCFEMLYSMSCTFFDWFFFFLIFWLDWFWFCDNRFDSTINVGSFWKYAIFWELLIDFWLSKIALFNEWRS